MNVAPNKSSDPSLGNYQTVPGRLLCDTTARPVRVPAAAPHAVRGLRGDRQNRTISRPTLEEWMTIYSCRCCDGAGVRWRSIPRIRWINGR